MEMPCGCAFSTPTVGERKRERTTFSIIPIFPVPQSVDLGHITYISCQFSFIFVHYYSKYSTFSIITMFIIFDMRFGNFDGSQPQFFNEACKKLALG